VVIINLVFFPAVASAAVPGILPGVVLMQKTKTGDLRPMNFGSKFKDGSLRVDIPLESLHLLFNVNYAIVSQGVCKGWIHG
jgi:predicted acylesterase/phospholipase RssA